MFEREAMIMTRDFEKNSPSMSKEALEKIVQSTQAQELLALLQKDGGAVLRQASQAASAGDYEKVQQLLAPKLQSKEAEDILKQLERQNG